MKTNRILDLTIYLLGLIASLPFLAPFFTKIGLVFPAKIIYFIYSFFCHQFSYRSIMLFDYQIAWCARDTAIWLSIFVCFVLVRSNFLPKIKWYWVIPFIIPMALDGGIQTIITILGISPTGNFVSEAFYVSNNLARFVTGTLFGIGVGWWLSWQIRLIGEQEYEKINFKFEIFRTRGLNIILKTGIIFCFMLLAYVLLVFLWRVSSTINQPTDWLDSAVKTPSTKFFERRTNGLCPTDATKDPLALNCFLQIDLGR
ncbi:DUF2085 domain-containing protein [Candidatus Dojkabacteria bacterium]|uniref:DUF2085 domain-containing protein n=1 Tax=Candidatus Dojkabacteria bacterium TaxID=2099670 RepID=A0A3M0YZC3_9BACT|nr:MAG: DUF2085 domain-containing protein [Candidatus Dojkabacteria bacterium]